MANNTNKTNKVNNNVATVNMNITANQLYSKLMSTTALNKELAKKTYQEVECDGKKKMVNAFARDYFVESYKKAEKLGNSAEWTARLIVAGTMESEHYDACFVSDKDFANQIGQSTAYISKAKDAVVIRNWLIDNGYSSDWKPSTVEELIATFKDFKKKELDFNTFMKVTGLKSTATVKAVREAKQAYKESLVSVKPKQENTSEPKQENTSEPKQENTSESKQESASGTVTTTSVSDKTIKVVGTDADIDALSANDVKTKFAFKDMTVTINFDGMTPITINLTDADNRSLCNPILTVLTGKIKDVFKEMNK